MLLCIGQLSCTCLYVQRVCSKVLLLLYPCRISLVGLVDRLFGPRRKMTNAIARWHSNARHHSSGLEQAYADRMEAEMQEMAIQVHKVRVDIVQHPLCKGS